MLPAHRHAQRLRGSPGRVGFRRLAGRAQRRLTGRAGEDGRARRGALACVGAADAALIPVPGRHRDLHQGPEPRLPDLRGQPAPVGDGRRLREPAAGRPAPATSAWPRRTTRRSWWRSTSRTRRPRRTSATR